MKATWYSFPRHAAAVLAASTLLACNDPVGSDTPYVVTPVSSTTLSGTPGWALTDTLVVEVRDGNGELVPGARVTWSLPQGGSLAVQLADAADPMTGTADSHGRNYAVWTLGLPEGAQVADAAAGPAGTPAEFVADASTLHASAVSAGSGYACAVLPDNRPVCWGGNYSGGLGSGDTTARAVPTPVVGLPAVQEIQASAFGRTCARDMSGDIWCWGYSGDGAGGAGATSPRQLTPLRVQGAEGASVIASPLYYGFTCALFAPGGAKCWGYNGGGQLGTGDFVSSAFPRAVVGSEGFASIASGENRVCALDAQGEAWCWGGAGGGEFSPLPRGSYPTPTQPVPGTRYSSIAVGYWSVCGVELRGGSSCFGVADLGTWTPWSFRGTSAPVRPDVDVNFRSIVYNGADAMFALSRYGEAYMWGEFNSVAPVERFLTTPRLTRISGGDTEFCGLSESGGIYCGYVGTWWNGRKTTVAGVPAMPGP
jgi:hypothetical protein